MLDQESVIKSLQENATIQPVSKAEGGGMAWAIFLGHISALIEIGHKPHEIVQMLHQFGRDISLQSPENDPLVSQIENMYLLQQTRNTLEPIVITQTRIQENLLREYFMPSIAELITDGYSAEKIIEVLLSIPNLDAKLSRTLILKLVEEAEQMLLADASEDPTL